MQPVSAEVIRPKRVAFWRRREVRVNAAVGLVLLALAFLFMLPGLPPARTAAPMEQLLVFQPWRAAHPDVSVPLPGGDILLQQLPWRHWMQRELAAGRFPLWASGPLGGYPIFANMQVAALYPLHLLSMLLPIGIGLGILAALKLWLAGIGMWGLLRALRLRLAAALLGALMFMFGAAMINWLYWQNSGLWLLLPWMAWAVYSWISHRRRWALPALAAIIACAVFAGHPETLILVGLTTAFWTVGLLVRTPLRSLPPVLGGLVVAVLVGFALGAVQLLPFMEALGLSHQVLLRNRVPGAASADLMIGWLLPKYWGMLPDRTLAEQHPFPFTENNAYFGIVGLLGVVAALLGVARRQISLRLVLPWLALTVFAWLVVYDVTLGKLLRSMPGFKESITLRWILVVSFGLIMLSAFGWDWLAGRAQQARAGFWRGVGAALLLVGAAALALYGLGLAPRAPMATNGPWFVLDDGYRLYWLGWAVALLLVALGLVALWLTAPRLKRVAPLLLAALLLIDLWTLLLPVNGASAAENYYPETRLLRDLEALPADARLLIADDTMPANTGLIYGIRDWREQDPMIPERAFQTALLISPDMASSVWYGYNLFLFNPQLPVATLLGMNYVVSSKFLNDPDPADPNRPPVTRLAYKDGLGLYHVEGVPGFAYLSDNLTVVPGEAEARAWLGAVTWEQVRTYPALVEGDPAAVSAVAHDAVGSSPGKTDLLEYSPGHIKLSVAAARPALAVVAESYYPGWEATIDGSPAPILRANYLSQGVVVPAGTHTVELNYRPASFRNGAITSVIGGVGLLALLLWAWRPWLLRRAALVALDVAGAP